VEDAALPLDLTGEVPQILLTVRLSPVTASTARAAARAAGLSLEDFARTALEAASAAVTDHST
jgi:uncharacterized protein (DUF1778 family)